MIAVIAALEQELCAVQDKIEDPATIQLTGLKIIQGCLNKTDVAAAVTGVGKVLTACNLQRAIDRLNPSAVLMVGIAGAIDPVLRRGDMVVAEDCLQHDMIGSGSGIRRGEIPFSGIREIPSSRELLETAIDKSPFPLKQGRILTGDQFIDRSDGRLLSCLTGELKGSAVDMEGASASLTAYLNHIPFLLIRTISDTAEGGPRKGFSQFMKKAAQRNLMLLESILPGIEGIV